MSHLTFRYICSNFFDEEGQSYLKLIYDDVCEQTDIFFHNFNDSVIKEFKCIDKQLDIEFYNELVSMCIEYNDDYKLDKNINGNVLFLLLGLAVMDISKSGISQECQQNIIELFTSFKDPLTFYNKYAKLIPIVYKELYSIQEDSICELLAEGTIISMTHPELMNSIDNLQIQKQ
jgi:hypothetical protein